MLNESIGQAIAILVGIAAPLLITTLGYQSNGGCACGCGIVCPAPYLRWDCGSDVGYACTNTQATTNPPFFGSPSRPPPCTAQPAAVVQLLRLFSFWLPCFFCLCATSSSFFAPIDAQMTRASLSYRPTVLPSYVLPS